MKTRTKKPLKKSVRKRRQSTSTENLPDKLSVKIREIINYDIPNEVAAKILGLSVSKYINLKRQLENEELNNTNELEKVLEDIKALTFYDLYKEKIINKLSPINRASKKPSIKLAQRKEELVLMIDNARMGLILGEGSDKRNYNYKVLNKRIETYVGALKSILSHHRHYEKVNVVFLGNMIYSPKIINHQNMYATKEYDGDLLQTMTNFARLIAGIAEQFAEVAVYGVCGEKSFVRSYEKVKENSYDYVFYKFMQKLLSKFKNIYWSIENPGTQVVNMAGSRVLIKESRVKNSGNMGISVGSIIDERNKEQTLRMRQIETYKDIDLFLFGRSGNIINYQNIVSNGNWIGTKNILAQNVIADARPSQLLFSLKKKGEITWLRKIDLST